MRITWIGHSCFKIEKNRYSIVIDPYSAGSVPGLNPVDTSANQVFCSHEHGDHNGRNEVHVTECDAVENPFTVEVLHTYHDEVQGAKRGKNQIFIINDGKYRVAHFGDLGCDLTKVQKEQLKNLDAAFVPVGGYYTIDGKQAAALMTELTPKLVIPMHFRDDKLGFGYSEISEVSDFVKCMDKTAAIQRVQESEIKLEDELNTKLSSRPTPESSIASNTEFETKVIILQPESCHLS